MATKTDRVLNSLRSPSRGAIAVNLILPNHSGDHSRGRVRVTPTTDLEIANKKYVDDAVIGHTRLHSIIDTLDHSSTATSGRMLKANANGLPVDATNTDAQVSTAVTDSHVQQHWITSTTDHNSTATSGKMLKADANGMPVDATNTDAQVSTAVTDSHAAAHDIASHSDTDVTGAMLTSLANDSMVDALHRHSELSAADGVPDKVILVNPDGTVMVLLASLPTADPVNPGQLWRSGGNVMISL